METIQDLERVLKVCADWDTDPQTKIIFTSLIHELCDVSRHCKELKETSAEGDANLEEKIQLLDAKVVSALADLTSEVKALREARIKDDGGKVVLSKVMAIVLSIIGVIAGALGGGLVSHLW